VSLTEQLKHAALGSSTVWGAAIGASAAFGMHTSQPVYLMGMLPAVIGGVAQYKNHALEDRLYGGVVEASANLAVGLATFSLSYIIAYATR
jgi:hypothetical protein